MAHRIIQLRIPNQYRKLIKKCCKTDEILDHWSHVDSTTHTTYSLLAKTQDVQTITDCIQSALGGKQDYRIIVMNVETLLPRTITEQHPSTSTFLGVSREELYEDVARNANINRTFILLVILSTIVASIGLLEDNVAVVIGAMVIAPLLGPNIALALATALGDQSLIRRAIFTNIVGVTTTLILSIGLGALWPSELTSHELLSRTEVGFDSIALAIAAGAAAVLSLTTGVSSVLVGVMVAVALLPPAVTLGIMIGAEKSQLAMGAGLLLAVNIVCVNLSAKLVFMFKGVKPRTWYQKQKAKAAMSWYLLFWIISLLILALIIYARSIMLT